MVLEGCIFKLWAFSLGRARLLSAAYLLSALFFIAWMLRRSRVRIGHAVVLFIFLTSPIFQLAGNTARMETLVLLVASAGFALLDCRRWAGLAVLACAPLVHPVGVLFLAVGCAFGFKFVREKKAATRVDLVFLGAVVLAWGLYVVHIVPQLGVFYDDMSIQMKFKSYVSLGNGGALSRLVEPLNLASLAGTTLALVARPFLGIRVEALAALAFATLLSSVLTEGWLYDVYAAFGALLASVLVLESVVARVAKADRTRAGALAKRALLVFVVVVLDAKVVALDPFIMRSVLSSTVQAWNADPKYLSADEHARVTAFLAGIAAENRRTKVQFVPDADALLFESSRTSSLGFVQRTFYASKSDVVVLHRSPWFPPAIRDLELLDIEVRNGIVLPRNEWREIARGSSGTLWTAIRKLPGKIDWH
jgi:hypothetical protein